MCDKLPRQKFTFFFSSKEPSPWLQSDSWWLVSYLDSVFWFCSNTLAASVSYCKQPKDHTEKWNNHYRIPLGQQRVPFAQHPNPERLNWCGILCLALLTIIKIRPWQAGFIWEHCKFFLPNNVLGKVREESYYRQVGLEQLQEKVMQPVFMFRCLQQGIWFWVALNWVWFLLLTLFRVVSC